ncbi:MAG: S8 family serine peptidase [Thermoanaerobaculia bacterium]
MRRTLPAVFVLLCATALSAATSRPIDDSSRHIDEKTHHFILSPSRALNDQEQADLASRGLLVERVLTRGRYLVRMTDSATVSSDDPRIASLEPMAGDAKLHRSARREMASARTYARLNILFHDDVPFESAKAAIEEAGGTVAEPLQIDFHVPRKIAALIQPTQIEALAADDRVLLVYGPMNLHIAPDNLESASASNVVAVQNAPYNLTGQGVALSYFELAAADASHPEFGGRLTPHGSFTGKSSSDVTHATHVGGTMIAAGVKPIAKGMAPSATLDEYDANNDNWLDFKNKLTSRSDNNSWGYVLGWCSTGDCASAGFVWGDDVYYGGYDALISAPLDKITRANGVLMVHSAGNDADKTGPSVAPFAHGHYDNNGKVVTGYCYSADGSGNDCPAPVCKSGPAFCEITRHPQITGLLPAPWVSIGLTASAKNVLAVGAVDSSRQIASFSSRGPTRDGRVKPDLVAVGVGVYSTKPSNDYESLSGTSMASPVVTGSSALLVEQWRRTFGGANPSAAALKTLMLATAQDLGNQGPDFTYGFGLLDAKAAVDTIIADGGQARRIKQDQLATGGKVEIPVSVTSAQTLRVNIGWSDPEVLVFPVDSGDPTDPLAASTLVNDLDLKVVDPAGREVLPYVLDPKHPEQPATRGVDRVDNTEEVEIINAVAGTYRIVVTGTSVTSGPSQAFVIVSNAELGVAAIPCTNPFAANNSADAAYGNVVSSQSLTGRTCDISAASYFKFLVDKAGPVNVTVTATDTPVRVTLSSNATPTVTAEIAAGETRTISTTYTGAGPTTFVAAVQPNGAIGGVARFTITPNFPFAETARRRAVRKGH